MIEYRLQRLLKQITQMMSVLLLVVPGLALATDFELRSVPRLPNSEVIWEDKPIYANGVTAPATHLRLQMPAEKVVAFYENYFTKADWELDKGIIGQNFKLFRKNQKFFYVLVMGDGKYVPCDVYLINSPADLAMCRDIQEYMLKENITPDTPGKDLPGLPRYPNSRRRLNFFAPYETAFLMYEAEAKPYEIAAFYRKALLEAGWTEDNALAMEATQELTADFKDHVAMSLFYRGEDILYINIMAAPKEARLNKRLEKRCIVIIAQNLEKELPFPGPEDS